MKEDFTDEKLKSSSVMFAIDNQEETILQRYSDYNIALPQPGNIITLHECGGLFLWVKGVVTRIEFHGMIEDMTAWVYLKPIESPKIGE